MKRTTSRKDVSRAKNLRKQRAGILSIPVLFDREATIMRLPGKVAMKYRRSMIAVEADQDCVQIRIPTNGLTPEEVNGLVSWLRVEAIVCHSRLTPQAAWQLAKEIKSDWWRANEQRFLPPGSE